MNGTGKKANQPYQPLRTQDDRGSLETRGVSLRSGALWSQLITQTWRNIKRSKINYCLGFTACFIVVFVVSLMVTVLSKSPLIFLRLAELSNGTSWTTFVPPSDGVSTTQLCSQVRWTYKSILALLLDITD